MNITKKRKQSEKSLFETKKLVDYWFRLNNYKIYTKYGFPKVLIPILTLFSFISEEFNTSNEFKKNNNCMVISETNGKNDTVSLINKKDSLFHSVYGMELIQMNSNTIHYWKFKIIKQILNIVIGICNINQRYLIKKTKGYGYFLEWSNLQNPDKLNYTILSLKWSLL